MEKIKTIKDEIAVTSLDNSIKTEVTYSIVSPINKNDTVFNNSISTENKKYLIQKRLFDIVFATLGILILSPLFLILSIIIKIEDRNAAIFFSQERVGINGKKFKMYKFRSMVSDAEKQLDNLIEKNEVTGAMFKLKDDPRVTKVGKFIRKTSMDELPQFWNVIKGEMSLVGPRPPLEREVDEYSIRDKMRLTVVPGCTGLWQATVRNSVGFDEMVNLDIEYIEKRSIFFDIKIILMTIKSILLKKAY